MSHPAERRVLLNCAGTLSQISLALIQAHPLTLLARSTAHLHHATWTSTSLVSDEIYFDRDPGSFAVILNFYRYGRIVVPAGVPFELVADDIVYFQLPIVVDEQLRTHGTRLNPPADTFSTASGPVDPYAPIDDAGGSGAAGGGRGLLGGVARQLPQTFTQKPSLAVDPYASVDSLEGQPSRHTPATATATPVPILPITPPFLTPATSHAVATSAEGQLASLLQHASLLTRSVNPASHTSAAPHVTAGPPVVAASSAITNYQCLDESMMSGGVVPPPNMVQILQPTMVRSASATTPQEQMAAQANASSSSISPTLERAATEQAESTRVHHASYAPYDASPPALAVSAVPVAVVASSPPASAAAAVAAVSPSTIVVSPSPRIPLDLSIEMFECFRDVDRAQASSLLDSSPSGTYLFRRASERTADGQVKTNLFVLSYITRERKVVNTKIWRLHIGRDNRLQAQTNAGFILTEHREPTKKEHTHASIMAITHEIIGSDAQALT